MTILTNHPNPDFYLYAQSYNTRQIMWNKILKYRNIFNFSIPAGQSNWLSIQVHDMMLRIWVMTNEMQSISQSWKCVGELHGKHSGQVGRGFMQPEDMETMKLLRCCYNALKTSVTQWGLRTKAHIFKRNYNTDNFITGIFPKRICFWLFGHYSRYI